VGADVAFDPLYHWEGVHWRFSWLAEG
jgi:hypothetical protein